MCDCIYPEQAKAQRGKSTTVIGEQGRDGMGVIANGYRVSSGGEENTPELASSDLYILKE